VAHNVVESGLENLGFFGQVFARFLSYNVQRRPEKMTTLILH